MITPRRWFPAALLGLLLVWGACASPDREGPGFPEETRILKVVTPSGYSVRAIYEIADRFQKKYPPFSVEVSVISGSSPINVFLSSKFAVGDVPDILIYQGGSSTALYAQGGHLLDLSGAGFEDLFFPGAEVTCRYEGRLYALPLDIAISGLFVQMSVLWRGYVKTSNVRIIPQTLDEFFDSCEKLKSGGIEYPVVIGAAGEMGGSSFLYQYMHQNIYAGSDEIYRKMLRGERRWTDGEFREMYRVYEQIRRYTNPDAARIDDMEAIRRFAGGEAAYYIGGSRDIAPIRQRRQDLDMLLVTPPWVREPSGLLPFSAVDTVISGSSASPYPDEIKALLGEFCSVYGAELYTQAVGSISAVKESRLWYDFCLGPQNDVYKNPLTGFMSREWLPGFEDLFRRLNREWFAGRSGDLVLEDLERGHRRIIGAGGTGF